MLPKWEERFSLHHELIDAQHQKLFALAQEVYILPKHASKTQIKVLFVEFFNYMAIHFEDEEAYMESINYPKIQEHRNKHEAIINEMTRILRTSPNIEKIRLSLLTQVKNWLIEHILGDDLAIEKWHKSQEKSSDEELIEIE